LLYIMDMAGWLSGVSSEQQKKIWKELTFHTCLSYSGEGQNLWKDFILQESKSVAQVS